MEAITDIGSNTSAQMLQRMQELVPFSADAPFRDNLATFIVNVLMLKAEVKSQDLIPPELLHRMVSVCVRVCVCASACM